MKAMLGETTSPSKGGQGASSDLDSEEEEDDLSGGFVSSGEEEGDDDGGKETAAAAGVVGGGGRDEEMEEIMEQMDRELEATEVGKSFEKMKVRVKIKSLKIIGSH